MTIIIYCLPPFRILESTNDGLETCVCAFQKQHQALEQKLSEENAVASQLQRKLYFAVKEEEGRIARQNQAFQQIHERSARPHSPVDQQ